MVYTIWLDRASPAPASRIGRPYVVEPMGMFVPIVRSIRMKRFYHDLLGGRLLRGASRVIATSEQERQEFLEGGGAAFYHSPIQPQGVQNTCLGWSSWSNFVSNENYEIKGYTSPYYAARIINLEWVQHRSGTHQMFPSSTDIKDADGNLLVTTYAVHRPDGNWSLMLVNRDENSPHSIRVVFENAKEKRPASFSGNVSWISFGSEQYVWQSDGPNSHPDPNRPPVATTIDATAQAVFTLPKASLTVLRGRVDK